MALALRKKEEEGQGEEEGEEEGEEDEGEAEREDVGELGEDKDDEESEIREVDDEEEEEVEVEVEGVEELELEEVKQVGEEQKEDVLQSCLISIETEAIPAFKILEFSFGKNTRLLIMELISSKVPVKMTIEQDSTAKDRIGKDRTVQESAEEDRTGQHSKGQYNENGEWRIDKRRWKVKEVGNSRRKGRRKKMRLR